MDLNKLDELIKKANNDSKKDTLLVPIAMSLESLRDEIIPSGMNIIGRYINSIISSLVIIDLVNDDNGKELTAYYRSELASLL